MEKGLYVSRGSLSAALLLGLSLLGLIKPHPAAAQFFSHTRAALTIWDKCQSLSANSRLPDGARGDLSALPQSVGFEVWKDLDGNNHYVLESPLPVSNGICRVSDREIFIRATRDSRGWFRFHNPEPPHDWISLKNWSETPPIEWSSIAYKPIHSLQEFVAADHCPAPDDTRYIQSQSVPDNVFKAFANLWEHASQSPAAFDAAFEKVQEPSFLGALRQAVLSHHPRVASINCNFKPSEALPRSPSCGAAVGTFWVGFDVLKDKVTITSVGHQLLI